MPILDMYDDPGVSVLRRHFAATGGGFTKKLASLEVQDDSTLNAVPDRLFALVGTYGGAPLRKYAMHDPEHLALSIVYFLECGGQLDESTRTKVAQRLIEGCSWYDTAPPHALTKVAALGAVLHTGAAIAGMPAKVRHARNANADDDLALRQAQFGTKMAGKARGLTSEAEAQKALDAFIRGEEKPTEQQYEEFGMQYPNIFDRKAYSAQQTRQTPEGKKDTKDAKDKKANTAGTELHSFGALSNDPRGKTPARRFAVSPKVSFDQGEIVLKTASVLPVDDTRHFALPERQLYPIDTEGQVKRASQYFDEYHRDFTMDDRRLYAQSVAMRAEQLDVPVGETIRKFAGSEYGPHILAELRARIHALEGTGKEASYQVLLENLDDTPPIVMYDLLKLADEDSGMDAGYGRPVTGFKDPLSAVFGAPEKPIYTWCGKGAYVTEEQLRSFSKLVPDLDKVIEDGFSAKFCNDPVKEFDKLPDPKKIVIARLANGEAFRWI